MNDQTIFWINIFSWFCGWVFGWIAAKDYFMAYPKELHNKIKRRDKK